jgi:hypothetical protein
MRRREYKWAFVCSTLAMVALMLTSSVNAQDEAKKKEKKKPDFPPIEKVTEDFKEVKVQDGQEAFFKLWKNEKTGQILAKLPKNYASPSTRHFIAPTVSGGDEYAGLQSTDFYVYWRKFGKRMALMQENLAIKGSDEESKSSVDRLFTDSVLFDVPIVSMSDGAPVINLNQLLLSNARQLFDSQFGVSPNTSLVTIKEAKAFPGNIEIAYEVPMYNGMLKTLHFSISKVEGSKGFKPRKADQRIGYFLTAHDDYGKYKEDETEVRYINRWHLEKRDADLKLSPPKQPIVFYIEHTTPVRYRRWVRQGILNWNKAFENIGIANAIEVRQQDKQTGEHMDLDPEDVRYNFVRWLNNNISTAIGPSRINPKTGEILDADIVLTDGWIRHFEQEFSNVMPKIMMDGVSTETLAWYAKHPNWDPRIRLADPSQREFLRQQIMYRAAMPFAGHAQASQKTAIMGDEPHDGLVGRASQVNGGCMAAEGRSLDVSFMRMSMAIAQFDVAKQKADKKKKKKSKDDDEEEEDESDEDEDDDEEDDEDKEQMLDGMPESFIGPLLADLVSHEVGHTLGLRHNFKASSVYDLDETNSDELKGVKPFAGSVMDYLPTNFKVKSGKVQGDYAMIGVGPYDMWAIEYGYTLDEKSLPKILKRVSEPQLAFATDEDTFGPDPLAKRYDFAKNPLDFAKEQVELANLHRGKILEKFVKDGQPWSKARTGYQMTLTMQTRPASMMTGWLGGTFVNRDKKGDPEGREPLVVVPAEQQREAVDFVIETMLFDDSFGLTPELLRHMTSNSFAGFFEAMRNEPAWPVHDRIMGLQASTLSGLMSPTRLRRVYDNEFRVPEDEDALTLNELMTKINDAIWQELDSLPKGKFTERKPAISSLRRNLQTEYIERLFDLAAEQKSSNAAMKPIANLASMSLTELHEKLEEALDSKNLDAYTKAHLADSKNRVQKFLDSTYVMNNDSGGGMGGMMFMFGRPAQDGNQAPQQQQQQR